MVLRALRKLLDWQGRPCWLMSIMWKRKDSSQQMQFSRWHVWFNIWRGKMLENLKIVENVRTSTVFEFRILAHSPICAKNHPNVGFQENRQFFRSCDLGAVGLKKTVNSELATSF
jgi:hypothetical protein